ncbi:general transcription factor II-I repeat domain-containing protein 2B-like [Lepeophtheirus salmonis]|uniref:general transcription factor II-I repeat domain-containing protein 2B-like n=1 Tax=Lepeophtheirus salmonis TaxID=72036 RepID=UPI001AE520C7|nr:general transcription factor II-I repeat domain-containing protein 2B-like [Lepeophtheirus salmonis]
MKASELVCPEKCQACANISLTRNTIAEMISELSEDLTSRLKQRVAFFVTIDESTAITDVVQLAIFIRGVDNTLLVTEEFVELVPMMDTTTAEYIFVHVVAALDRVGGDWSRSVSIATDDVPSMIGNKLEVVTKFKGKMQVHNGGYHIWAFHCIFHQEELCCKSLKMDHVTEVVVRTVNFFRARGLNRRQFETFLRDRNITHSLPYHSEVRWLG